jgi:nucleoside-diphosphate-sugar epimerase
MKKVLLTGASGFVGQNAIGSLENKDFIILSPNSKELNLLDSERVKDYIEMYKPSHLLHFAWDVTPGKYLHSSTNQDWLEASIKLLEVFKKNGGERAVVAGTQFEYFYDYSYPACKKKLLEILETLEISYAWGRIFYLYGENEYPTRLVPSIINSLLQGKEVKCTDGEQIRDFMYVKDVSKAFVELLDSEVQGVVDIGHGEGIKIKELIYKIAQMLNGTDLIKLGALQKAENEIDCVIADNLRLKNEVGFTPEFTIDESIKKVIEWSKANLYTV